MPERSVIADTGPIVAFLVEREPRHAWAVQQFKSLPAPLLTCEPVLTEVFHLLSRTHNGQQRFFDLLRRLGLDPICHAFPDHHHYLPAEIEFPDATVILMTEKDAVKCAAFADGRCWYLPIRARIEPALVARLEGAIRGRQAA